MCPSTSFVYKESTWKFIDGRSRMSLLNVSTTDLSHDGSFATQIFVAERQKTVDDKGFITISNSMKIDVIVIVGEHH